MARKKSSPADAAIELVSQMSWWAGVALVVLSYVLLHLVASAPPPAAQPAQLAGSVMQIVARSGATVGQYILPILFMVGAGVSAWKRRERKGLIQGIMVQSPAADGLVRITWQQFEKFVGEGFSPSGLHSLRDRWRRR